MDSTENINDIDEAFEKLHSFFNESGKNSKPTFPAILSLTDRIFIDSRYRNKIQSINDIEYLFKLKKEYTFIRPSGKNTRMVKKLLEEGRQILLIHKKGIFFDNFVSRLPYENLSRHFSSGFFSITVPAPSIRDKVESLCEHWDN